MEFLKDEWDEKTLSWKAVDAPLTNEPQGETTDEDTSIFSTLPELCSSLWP